MFRRSAEAPRDLTALEARNRELAGELRRRAAAPPRSDGAAAIADWARRRDLGLQPAVEQLERQVAEEAETIAELERRLEEIRGFRSLKLLRRLLG